MDPATDPTIGPDTDLGTGRSVRAARVAEAYDRDPEREWERLTRDAYHTLELHSTLHALLPLLPAGCAVLDAGGGPGRYALELCRAGHRVTLLDLSPGNVAFARRKFADEPEPVRRNQQDCLVGDVRDLSRFPTHGFDAALCLGPLTHLPDVAQRRKALHELARVVRPGAPVAVGVVGYHALMHDLTRPGAAPPDPERLAIITRGDDYVRGMLWHFFGARELSELAESCGYRTVTLVGCEGLASGLRDATNAMALDAAKWAEWLEQLDAMSTLPVVVEIAEHLVYIGTPTE